jgi:hypothetical protein
MSDVASLGSSATTAVVQACMHPAKTEWRNGRYVTLREAVCPIPFVYVDSLEDPDLLTCDLATLEPLVMQSVNRRAKAVVTKFKNLKPPTDRAPWQFTRMIDWINERWASLELEASNVNSHINVGLRDQRMAIHAKHRLLNWDKITTNK